MYYFVTTSVGKIEFKKEFWQNEVCHFNTELWLIIRLETTEYLPVLKYVRRGSHRGGSPQDGLGDEQTCGTTLASAYVLRHLSTAWSQLQMKERESEWKWVLIGVSPLNTGDWVQ